MGVFWTLTGAMIPLIVSEYVGNGEKAMKLSIPPKNEQLAIKKDTVETHIPELITA
jgi:hypothetical protein